MRLPFLARVIAGAAFATLLSSASVLAGGGYQPPPDQQTGSIGGVVIRDSKFDTGVACRYGDQAVPKLDRFVIQAPAITWPDTNADNDNQHGKVGYRVIIEQSIDEGVTWMPFGRSDVVRGIAYEQTPASLKKIVFRLQDSGQKLYRVVIKVSFYRPDGRVRGTLRHWQWIHWIDGPTFNGEAGGYCYLRLPN